MKTVFLDIRSWVGMSIGATHYYAHLQCGKVRKELKYPMTASQAARINKLDNVRPGSFGAYDKGEESSRFFTMDELIFRARQVWKNEEYFPGGQLLIEGDPSVYDPQTVLWCEDLEFMRLANKLVAWAERIGWWDKNEKQMKRVEKNWEWLCNKYLGVRWPGLEKDKDDEDGVDKTD